MVAAVVLDNPVAQIIICNIYGPRETYSVEIYLIYLIVDFATSCPTAIPLKYITATLLAGAFLDSWASCISNIVPTMLCQMMSLKE